MRPTATSRHTPLRGSERERRALTTRRSVVLTRPVATVYAKKYREIPRPSNQPIRRRPSFVDVIPVEPKLLRTAQPSNELGIKLYGLQENTSQTPAPLELPTDGEKATPEPGPQEHSATKRSNSWKAIVLYVSAAAILVTTGVVTYQTWRTNTEAREVFGGGQPDIANANIDTAPDISSREGIDETLIEETQKSVYIVAPDMPRIIRIPDLNIEARVLRMGVNAKGNIEAPAGIWDTGWYDGSAKPGHAGNAFIDGHISGPTQPAIFERLHTIKSGAKILIERGDGSVLTYAVQSTSTEEVERIDMRKVLAGPSNSDESITLMTCGGEYLKDYTYKSRVIVVANRVE